jgi:hypothetical protein
MTDTLKRLAGPTQVAQTNAGTLLYTVPGSTTTAVKSILLNNTDPVMGAFFSLAIGSDLSAATGLDNRILSNFYVAPSDTAYVPLDLVLDAAETLYARQSCMIEPTQLTIAAAVAATNAGSASSIVSASWTEAVDDLFLLTVALFDTSATAVVSSFTDTHTGVSWTALQSFVNATSTFRVYQYTAQSTGTTGTTTTVTFDSTCDSSSLAITKITALTSLVDDASGTNGSTAFRALGISEAPLGTTPLYVAKEMGAAVLNHNGSGTAAETQTVLTGWTEIDDFSTTNAASMRSARLLAPASWTRPTLSAGARVSFGAFTEILNNKRSITCTLDGVEVT